MVSRPLTVNVGSFNLPEMSKRGLLDRVKRAQLTLDLTDDLNLDFVGVQEAGSFLKRATESHSKYKSHWATPNERRGQLFRGNGVLYNAEKWRLVRHTQIYCDIPDGPATHLNYRKTRRIYLPCTLFEDKRTNVRVWFITVHKPRGIPGYRRARRQLEKRIRAFAQEHKRDLIVLSGDWNGKPMRFLRLRTVARHGVDAIVASRKFKYGRGRPIDLKRRKLSDHNGIVSNMCVPEPRGGWG